jgi:hypothetical protein
MALKSQLSIQESIADLKHLFRRHPVHLHSRNQMLYLIQSRVTDSTNDLSKNC